MLIGMVFVIIWEMFHGRISLNSVLLLLLLLNFVSGFWLEFPCQKYQVKSHHSSPWFSAAWAAAIVHRNHFFHLHQKDKSPECKIKLRQVSNHCKRVLEAAKLAYANKTKKSPSLPWNLALGTCGKLPIMFSKVNLLAILPLFNGLDVFSSASDKAKLFAEIFSMNPNLENRYLLTCFPL